MTRGEITFSVILIVLALYQSYATWRVARSEAYSQRQKALQIALVWLVPVIGAALAHWFASQGVEPLPKQDREHIRQDLPPPGVPRVRW